MMCYMLNSLLASSVVNRLVLPYTVTNQLSLECIAIQQDTNGHAV